MESLQGQLLVASPHLQDPNFLRTVILLVQHSDQGAFGLVLNRPINKSVKELWAEVHEPSCQCTKHLNMGGPVTGPLMALHTQKGLSEVEVLPGLFFSAEKGHLEQLVQRDPKQFKLFVGHSGWGSDQLENELKQGAWLTAPATVEYIFFEESGLWKHVVSQIGKSMLTQALHLKDLPEEPWWN
jgi:putative transcriptional regulator